ncbi:MAG TPA: farnesyl diphosphate synthase, partial [Burkholderiales bacterium]|nr:farnesyl diphosphate synthase [Burkholderiales bacterium]
MGAVQARMEAALARLLPAGQIAPARLHEAMRYATLEGGKRVRPLLAFAAGEVSGASAERLELAAAAVEMIHAYSLAHDDLPCMDDDVLRRGKPTVHVEYDEPTALLVGDALQSLAFQVLSESKIADRPESQLEMVKLLAAAAGSRGMAGGQQIDLESTGQALTLPELEMMHVHKTGALIRAAVLLGYACGERFDEAHRQKLDKFAKAIGLAFQVVDDVLDYDGSTATLGKTAGKDSKHGKPT